MGRFADLLVARLDRSSAWPLPEEAEAHALVQRWIAYRESERDQLRVFAGWKDDDRRYQVDPVARRISSAFSSLIFGRHPEVRAAEEADKDRLRELVEDNKLGSRLQRAVRLSSSEGEVWWRIVIDPDVAEHPLVEWHSRSAVVPQWAGERLVACAFFTAYDLGGMGDEREVLRHFEVHDATDVRNVLYSGDTDSPGERIDLTELEETAGLAEEWPHELPGMLAGRILNLEGEDPKLGLSDYQGIEDFLLNLDESVAIGHENMRLTAKRRVVVPASAVDAEGELPAGREAIVVEDPELSEGMGEGGKGGPWRVLEYTFDAGALNAHRQAMLTDALTSVGITPQFVGVSSGDSDGSLTSGTALRIRLIPSTNAGEERAQFYDDDLPQILRLLQLAEAKSTESGGFGRPWTAPNEPPAVERGPSLPEDPVEEATRHSTLVTAKIESRETAVRSLHPDWSPEEVDDELERITEDAKADADGARITLPFGGSEGGARGSVGQTRQDAPPEGGSQDGPPPTDDDAGDANTS